MFVFISSFISLFLVVYLTAEVNQHIVRAEMDQHLTYTVPDEENLLSFFSLKEAVCTERPVCAALLHVENIVWSFKLSELYEHLLVIFFHTALVCVPFRCCKELTLHLAPPVAAVSDFSLRVILGVEFWITEILLIDVLEERLRRERKPCII